MSLLFMTPCTLYFAARMAILKNVSDVIFVFACLLMLFASIGREERRVFRLFHTTLCGSMCVLALVMMWYSTFFDPTTLLSAVMWLVMLVHPFFTDKTCSAP